VGRLTWAGDTTPSHATPVAGDLRPAWSRQKQVSRNDELRYHNDFQRRRVIAQERSVRCVTVIRTGAISQHKS
jgi:hypothetical protein